MAVNCTRLIGVDRLTFADNVRTPECMQLPGMVESLRRHGFKYNHPLIVSEKRDGDGLRYLVLVGNRRGLGLHWLRENDLPAYQEALPGGRVPAIVHKNLTKEEEIELRIDHSPDEDRVPLDEWSTFCAIKQLVQAQMDTQERIAIKLGLFKTKGKEKGQPNRQYVQPRVNLARLPGFVQEEYRKLSIDKDDTPVRWPHVAKLYKAYNAEYIQHPHGDGPRFQEVWKEVMTPSQSKDSKTDGKVGDPKELTPADAVKRSQGAQSEGLKQALLVVTRQSGDNLADIDNTILAGETALRTLGMIRAYLGNEDYGKLLTSARAHQKEREQAEKQEAEKQEAEQKTEQEVENGECVHSQA